MGHFLQAHQITQQRSKEALPGNALDGLFIEGSLREMLHDLLEDWPELAGELRVLLLRVLNDIVGLPQKNIMLDITALCLAC